MITRFVELHKREEHMVFHYVMSYKKILCVPKYLFYSTMILISNETWRETSIRSSASILFVKSELPCRALCPPGVILKFKIHSENMVNIKKYSPGLKPILNESLRYG